MTNMKEMFRSASSFNQPIGTDEPSGICRKLCFVCFIKLLRSTKTVFLRNMKEMFRSAYSFNQDIGSWKTSQVTSTMMFVEGAEHFELTSSVTSFTNMFKWATTFRKVGVCLPHRAPRSAQIGLRLQRHRCLHHLRLPSPPPIGDCVRILRNVC